MKKILLYCFVATVVLVVAFGLALMPCTVQAVIILDPSDLSPGFELIDFEDFDTQGELLTPLPNPVTFGNATFTSLTGTGPSIFDISLSPNWPQDLTQVSSKTMFPGGEPDSAIAIEFASPVSEILLGWGDPDFEGNVLQAFDADGQLLEEGAVELGVWAAWIGFKRPTADIAKVIVQPAQPLPSGDDYVIDNVHYNTTVVPEPTILFGWKYSGAGLVSIDTETGETTLVISSDRQIEGLAFDSINGVLYGVENLSGDNMLVEIDLETESISEIGPVVGFTEVTAMTFDETTDTIFALDQTTQRLLEIEPSTGESIAIGNFSQGASNGLAAQPITGDLFAAVSVDPGYLARIDKTTGDSTLLGSFGDCHVRALSFHPDTGVLFGNAGGPYGGPFADGRFVTIDLITGLATPIGEHSGQITALAFVVQITPEITIAAIIDFFNASIDDGSLKGNGRKPWLAKHRLCVMRWMLEITREYIEEDRTKAACAVLKRIHRRCDESPKPPDFVEGEAVGQLAGMVYELAETLGCKWAGD